MVYRNIDEFLIRVEQSSDVTHITKPVKSDLEIAHITYEHLQKTGPEKNKVLWFDHVDDQSIPVVTNLFSTEKRMAWALGLDHLKELADRMSQLIAIPQNMKATSLLNRAGEIMSAIRSTTNRTSHAKDTPYSNLSLRQLPFIRHWPKDPYPSISHAQFVLGMATPEVSHRRIVRFDDETIGIEAHIGDQFLKKDYPAAIVIGGDPAVMWATSMKLPGTIQPYWLAGWLRRKALNFVDGTSQAIQYVDDAEFIIEGTINPQQIQQITLSQPTGFYQHNVRFYVMKVSDVLGRRDGIMPIQVITDQPYSEQFWQNKACEYLLKPIIKFVMQNVDDIEFVTSGMQNPPLVVKTHTNYPGQIEKTMYGLWGMDPFAYTKTLLAIDKQINAESIPGFIGNALHHWQNTAITTRGLIENSDSARITHGTRLGLNNTLPQAKELPYLDSDLIHSLIGDCWFTLGDYTVVAGIPQNSDTEGIIDQLKCSITDYSLILIDSQLMSRDQLQMTAIILTLVNWDQDVEVTDHRIIMNLVGKSYERLTYEGQN